MCQKDDVLFQIKMAKSLQEILPSVTPAKKSKTTSLAEWVVLVFSAISTVFTLGWVLWYSRYGIDFTDESFYLVSIFNPFNYALTATQFGFIYHPLYQLVDGNIAALRQANMLITFCLAWALSSIFLKSIYGNQALARAPRLVISAGIATASLALLDTWLPTPSYNSLALQALLVVNIGLLQADKNISSFSIAGWVLIGIGGWLAFMAKPPTAAALGVCSVLYLLAAGKFGIRYLVVSLATAVGLLVLSALAIDGSVITFIERLRGGMELAKMLGGGHTLTQLLRVDDFQLGGKAKIILTIAISVIFVSAYLSQSKIKEKVYAGTTLSILIAIATMAIVFGLTHQTINAGMFQGLLFWSIPFAAILVEFALYRFKFLIQISRSQWALALNFFVLPHVFAFGTANNYWVTGIHAGIFWVLAGLVLLAPVGRNHKVTALLLPFGLAVQLVTVALVQSGIEAPYRQPQPLHENDYKIDIGRPGSALALSKNYGQYFADAIELANRAQFKIGTPMIDLTGQSPGILYALGASNIGQAWTIGGYPGSSKLAVAALKTVSCENLSVAWLLLEPEGPRKISAEVLSSFGADIAADYEIAGTLKTAEGAGGYNEKRVQLLLRPVRAADFAMTACEAARKTTR